LKKCAFLTIKDLSGFESYDHLLIGPMQENGWDVSFIPWDKLNQNWNDFDLVIVRSTWNYQDHLDEFLNVLRMIDQSRALLLNPLPLIEWNVNKTYLKDLKKNGIPIIPSLFFEDFDIDKVMSSFNTFDSEKVIIKPTVGANADKIMIIKKSDTMNKLKKIKDKYKNRPFILQPFINSIKKDGEMSLIFFNKGFSHGLSKVPKKGDFRVQEEHGGTLELLKNLDDQIINLCKKVLSLLPYDCFYSRIDLIFDRGHPLLMEIEVIEPSLYFNLEPKSAKLFAKKVSDYFNRQC